MVTLDDIAAAVIARCAASSEFAAALPGGAHLDRGPDQPAGAYAVMTLERDGDPEWDSGGVYLQGYTLRMVAYTVQGLRGDNATPQQASDVRSPQAAQLALAAALNVNPTAWDALRDGRVNVCLPRGYDGKHAPELREGRDVFAAAAQWHLLIEGER
jgi:hypothetical protein